MKKLFFIATFIFVFGLALPTSSFAQGMMGNITGANNATLQDDDGHTAREEAEGKAVWEKLQAKELTCEDLTDNHFGTLGEYFMGQMAGDAHEAMNNMMIRMMGEKGEEQTHVVMGKRLSGCDTSVALPSGAGFMPMMNMMMGGLSNGQEWSSPFGLNNQGNNSMMNFGFASFGWIFMVLWWFLIIAGIIALIKWLTAQSRGSHNHEKSPLDLLKERYVKGEINKEEFEQKKKDISN